MNIHRENIKEIKYNILWMISIITMFFYTFFFQYGVYSIDGIITILCLINILFSIFHIVLFDKFRIYKSSFNLIIIFVIFTVVISGLFSYNGLYGLNLGIKMIEYVLTSYSVFLFLVSNPHNFIKIMWSIYISITLLAITALVKGTVVTPAGAIGLLNLNTNQMSSYFILMIFISFILWNFKNRLTLKLTLIICNIIVIVAQIYSASRRGFLVLLFMIFVNIFLVIIPKESKRNILKKLIMYLTLIILIVIGFSLLKERFLNSTLLGARLTGMYDSGDLARQTYQNFAIDKFKSHPIWGIGIGGIAYYVGVYSHSLYYEVLSCTGIFGSIILFSAFIKMGIDLFKIYFNNTNNYKIKYTACVTITYLISILISGISVVMIYDLYFYLSIAIISAIIMINYEKYSNL